MQKTQSDGAAATAETAAPATVGAAGDNLRLDGERLWQSIHEMAEIGPGVAGGNNRQALSDADGEGRALFRRWCEGTGLAVGVDRMGTMYARRDGTDPDALPVCMGSHLDTQPTGGRYDGILGVLGALEVMRTIEALGIRTRRPILAINWTNEEGTRFAPPMMASGVYAGLYDAEWAYGRTDAAGLRFGDELSRIGWMGEEEVGARRMHAFFELHIEQGPILEAEGIDIGVVTGGQGLRWVQCTLTGRESHAGSTPMTMRRDAGLTMAHLASLVNRIAMDAQPDAVGTVGHMEVHPNSRNVVPGRAVFTADLRSPDLQTLQRMEARLIEEGAALCDAAGVEMTTELLSSFDPPVFDAGCVAAVRRAAERLGYSHRDIVSGAGHDACWINTIVPSGMIFCPCVGGLSHNEAEEITLDWAAKGANVLMHAVLEAAEIVA
ncbi:MAG: Zn-dependent hydrolase [Pseudomonadota bacterium]